MTSSFVATISIPNTAESIAHAAMSVIWFQPREPTRNPYILIELIGCVVETSDYVVAVGILVADVDHSLSRSWGISILFQMVECRNGVAICPGMIWRV